MTVHRSKHPAIHKRYVCVGLFQNDDRIPLVFEHRRTATLHRLTKSLDLGLKLFSNLAARRQTLSGQTLSDRSSRHRQG